MRELIELGKAKNWILKRWNNSLGYILVLIAGILIGKIGRAHV